MDGNPNISRGSSLVGLGGENKKKGRGARHATAEIVIVHLARIALDVVVFGRAFEDFEIVAGDHYVGGVGATGPFLAVGAVAEGCQHGLGREFVLNG